ncbi:hypothetical protein N7492_002632 [Penicillium capsulatum]|uniref:Uncharacterized protein n=1 Tax=Penicillium capsulatum TaxID=69766 RepID=A0A9W9LWM0_9EURO|nr:hypothetical protein N7492_002632 [Penicillium capsulatum]KAJ6122767.1 hypothetical protein N7512_005232 [Penicillium capsulatum]
MTTERVLRPRPPNTKPPGATDDEPPLLASPYDLDHLPPPPPHWEFLGQTCESLIGDRSTTLLTIEDMAKHHLWGFKFPAKNRPKKSDYLRALWKVFYHMRDEYRPKTWPDLFLKSRDAGPRLLQYTILPLPRPVSRFHPYERSAADPLPPWYVRSFDAPQYIPDRMLCQFLLPPDAPHEWPPTTPPEFPNVEPSGSCELLPDAGPLFPGVFESPSNEDPGMSRRPSYTPGYEPGPVIQAMQKAMFKVLYADLERAPDAPAQEPVASLTAQCDEDLRTVQIGVHPAHSHVRLDRHLRWDASNDHITLPYRGRGPVWKNGSCSIDSIIVLGKLLQAGSTVIDRKDNRPQQWSIETKMFVEATNINWEALPREVSSRIRDMFWEALEKTFPYVRDGLTWVVFSAVTSELAQFQYHGRDCITACSCEGGAESSISYSGNCVSHNIYEDDHLGVDVATLLGRVWYGKHTFACPHCGTENGSTVERRIEQLPLRLVMNTMLTSSDEIKIERHTADFEIEYPDAQGNTQKARYRWLGGIYHRDNHAKVFFRDTPRGEVDFGELCVYDGAVNSGIIVGGVPRFSDTEWVPSGEVAHGMVIVVYELVRNPSMDDLAAASAGVNAMSALANENQFVLSGIEPWPRPSPHIAVPEPRVIPVAADRFFDVEWSELPGGFDPDPKVITARDLASMYSGDRILTPNPETKPESMSGTCEVPSPNRPRSHGLSPDPRQNLADFSPWTNPEMTSEEIERRYPELFNFEGMASPGFLADNRDFWPNGTPGEGGTTSWPVLPRASPISSPQLAPPLSPTKEFLNLSDSEASSPGNRGWVSGEGSVRLDGSGDRTMVGVNPQWSDDMEDIQFDGDNDTAMKLSKVHEVKQWKMSSSHRGPPRPRPKMAPARVEKDSMRKRAIWNAMTEKKKKASKAQPKQKKHKRT